MTLYESLIGINPFRANTVAETIERLLRETPRPVRDLRSDCPPKLSEFFVRSLSKNLADRPVSARAFKAALDTVQVR